MYLLHQRFVSRLCFNRKAFEIQVDTLVLVARQECQQLLPEAGACLRTVHHVRDVQHPLPTIRGGIEVVDQRQDFHIRFFKAEKLHYLLINRLNFPALEHGIELVLRTHRLDIAVGRNDVQPFGIEDINLVKVLAERSEAARVPGHVERSANAFVGVQHDLRCRFRRLAAPGSGNYLRVVGLFFL